MQFLERQEQFDVVFGIKNDGTYQLIIYDNLQSQWKQFLSGGRGGENLNYYEQRK